MAAFFLPVARDYVEPSSPANGIRWAYPKENWG